LTGISLTITGNPLAGPTSRPSLVVNMANLRGSGTIAPGELVSILGAGLGPQTAVTAPSGNLPTSLGGTTVTIGGTAVPISYASLYRVDFQAPFSLAAGGTVTIQVSNSNGTSTGIPVTVVSAVPGLFTKSVDGTGQITAFNQSGSANSIANTAAKGSVVVLYATGLGVTDPAVQAGDEGTHDTP